MCRRNSFLAACAIAMALLVNLATAASPTLSTPLSLSPTAQKSLLSPSTPVAQPFLNVKPVLTAFSPPSCANPGQQIRLSGSNLGAPSGRHLVMDTGQGLLTLVFDRWTNTQIRARLPANFPHHGKVSVGIHSAAGWLGLPLTVPICAQPVLATPLAAGVPLTTLATPTPTLAPIAPQTSPPASPAGTTPVPEAAPSQDGAFLPPMDSGSLLGSALPPVPEGLNLTTSEQDTPQFTPHELVAVTASMADAQYLQQLMMQGYQARVVRRRKLGSLGVVISAFHLPDSTSVAETLTNVRQQYPDLWIDVNHYFRPMAARVDPRASLYRAIARNTGERCGRGLRVGLLDGPVDVNHPALKGQAIKQKQIFARGRTAASTRHATAVASLLVGNPAVTGLGGAISEAQLAVGVVMQQGRDDDTFSTAEDLLTGLNWLLQQPVQDVILSLGGPRNALLEVALQRVLALGVGVVAAAGNGGPGAAPSYPAAQAGVVAVTAIDSEQRVAADANRGDYIDLAAPGVDVWVADEKSGARYASGSSMAAPLVAAAMAQLGGNPAVAAELFKKARDLGSPGKDPLTGWGLLQFPACAGR